MAQAVAAQAAGLAGYDDASRLRQAQDTDWVLDLVDRPVRTIADLGCGTGSLLAAALDRFPGAVGAVGLDREDSRLTAASGKLAPYADRIALRFVRADLRCPPRLAEALTGASADAGVPSPGATGAAAPLAAPTAGQPALDRLDLITMTSVLHWIHPDEPALVRWVAEHLTPGGTFLLTTHHPVRDEHGLGGSDDLAREALVRLGIARDAIPGLMAAAGIIPIAVRALSVADTERLLGEWLEVDVSEERSAVVRASSGAEYQRFHAATFGTYYSRLVGPDAQDDYFHALGEVAQQRLDTLGHVTEMPVRRWRARAHH